MGRGCVGGFSMEEFIMREENFHEGGAVFSSIVKKKMKKNKNKNSTGSMDQH